MCVNRTLKSGKVFTRSVMSVWKFSTLEPENITNQKLYDPD